MTDIKSDLDNRFSCSCPRKLSNLPNSWCPLGALRMKAIRTLGREPTQSEESGLPGCQWAINHQLSGYCWFKYESEYMPETPLSDQEIAALLSLAPETIKKTSDTALNKVRQFKSIKDLRASYGKDPIIEDSSPDDDSIYE